MIRRTALFSGLAAIASALSLAAFAQGKPQTLSITRIDPTSLATGYRTSKVVGSTVYNDTNEAVGMIDDLIVTPNDKIPYAVLSVGGFLGMGTRLVVVPINTLEVKDKRMVLHDATKESLKLLPAFVYAD